MLTCKCVCVTEKLVEEMGDNEQQEIIEELSDLDALLPDLEAKVNKQCYHVHYITTTFDVTMLIRYVYSYVLKRPALKL